MYTIPGLSGTARTRYSEDQSKKIYEKTFKLIVNSERDDRLLYIVKFFLIFSHYEIHLKKYNIIENKSCDVTKRELWEEQEKLKNFKIIERHKKTN
jgi:hypothetical protein